LRARGIRGGSQKSYPLLNVNLTFRRILLPFDLFRKILIRDFEPVFLDLVVINALVDHLDLGSLLKSIFEVIPYTSLIPSIHSIGGIVIRLKELSSVHLSILLGGQILGGYQLALGRDRVDHGALVHTRPRVRVLSALVRTIVDSLAHPLGCLCPSMLVRRNFSLRNKNIASNDDRIIGILLDVVLSEVC